MKKSKLLGWALMALASLSACTDNAGDVLAGENEIRLTSEITPSRVTSLDYQSTQIVPGQEVGITITGAKAAHKNVAWRVGEDGELTNTGDPVFWANEDVIITAYHPYNSAWTGTSHEFSVSTDQSDHANYRNSDLLWAMTTSSMTKTAIPLVFEHKLAKVNVTLRSEDIDDLSGAVVSICGTNVATSFNPTTGSLSATSTDVQEIKAGETTSSAYTASAIVVPQTVTNGTKFIKIVLGDKTFYYTLSTDKELRAGYSHNYTLTIKDMEVTAESDKITDWEDDDNEGNAEINGDIEKENLRKALIKLYQSTNGDNWTDNTNWCSDKPIEEWYGVYRDDNGKYQLDLSNNNLTGKIEQTFPDDLYFLSFLGNQLTSLDVSGCTSLESLQCQNNQLTSLKLSGCTSLNWLNCTYNQLTSLNVSGCTSLETLSCYNNQLTSLDASGCTSLNWLACYRNQLTSLDVSGCTSLVDLLCQDNQLTSLNVSGCTSLECLSCGGNQLTSLNASGCTSLNYLNCPYNQLTSLDVSGCTSLEQLYCDDNQLTSLDVSDCTSLVHLQCNYNQLTSLNVSGCTSLETLSCPNNQLTSLDASGCTSLKSLHCGGNQLTSLDVSGCTSLGYLDCNNNQLTSLDVSSCTSLVTLWCSSNQLTSLDVSGCTSLMSLYCYVNQLTSLDVSGCTSLVRLVCHENQISSEIPEWFSQLEIFEYDQRYTYNSEYTNGYKDNGYGWWYPGEPEKGYHDRN